MIPKWIQRIRHSRGYGVHSPFAFNLITGIINDESAYYAFFDIDNILFTQGLERKNKKLNHLSYRLLMHFKSDNALEIGSANNTNTFYIASALQGNTCYFVDEMKTVNEDKKALIKEHYNNVEFISKPEKERKYYSIFIAPKHTDITPEELFYLSDENCFWVVSGIKSGAGKHFWKKTVIDKQANVTLEMKDIGIAFINSELSKRHYFI